MPGNICSVHAALASGTALKGGYLLRTALAPVTSALEAHKTSLGEPEWLAGGEIGRLFKRRLLLGLA